MKIAVRAGTHLAVFIAAILIFCLGLGVGLAFNATIALVLWVVAGVIAVTNVVLIVVSVVAEMRGDA